MTRAIGFLLYPDFQLLDAAGPVAAFELAGRLAGQAYTLCMLSHTGGAVVSSSGVAVQTVALDGACGFDTLVTVGGEGHRAAMTCGALLAFLRGQARGVRRMCSVCSGAFVLAAAGLLAGRRATTHWRPAPEFSRLFANVRLAPDAIYIHDGPIWTAAGISAGIDLALALVSQDLGDDIARQTARQMVGYHRRPGGQSQFSALLELEGADERFTTLLGWVRAHLTQRLSVEVLAAQVGMSPRNFSRAFHASVGTSPARAVERLRLEAAQARVTRSTDPVEAIARATGFHDPERMRRAFIRAFGQPPQALRRNAARGP